MSANNTLPTTWEEVLERVEPRLVPSGALDRVGGSVPCHVRFLDLEVVLGFRYVEENRIVWANILPPFLDKVGAPADAEAKMLEAAIRNMEENGFCCAKNPILAAYGEITPLSEFSGSDDDEMIIVTNREKRCGANVLLSENALETLREKVGAALWILPSSRDEVILLPDRGGHELGDLREMVHSINRSGVVEKDMVLSDSVYRYEGSGLKIAC